jgi:hypothetical protein
MSSKQMNISDNEMLEPLKHIQKVEPSSHLFSKIENRINEELQQNTISKTKLMAACVLIIVLLASNTIIIRKTLKTTNSTEVNLTETFGINTSNQLYNE